MLSCLQWNNMPWDLLALFQAVRSRGGHAAAATFDMRVWTAIAVTAWANTPGSSLVSADAQVGARAKAVYDAFLRRYDIHLCKLVFR